ncbi:hypothetical protein [Larkinella terrae]|uniref:Uncharacterized protein n=1 Tax=Larkinella terrae TaxID=2025311 RepID=A0A7K0ESG0_9BACT|nr:hypothetical protein [Larkinella terrae]MRS64753.1 hypothetical protein [Larkinella terrae]
MLLFLGLSSADLIFYTFLLLLLGVVFLYVKVKRIFGPGTDYDSDYSDMDWDTSDYDGDGED